MRRFIGPPLATAFVEMTGDTPDSALVASCVASYRRCYAAASLRDTTVIPGIVEVLSRLARHFKLAVAIIDKPGEVPAAACRLLNGA